jgi:LysM repeat protein
MAPPFESDAVYATDAAPPGAAPSGVGMSTPPFASAPFPGTDADDNLPPPFPPEGYAIAPDPTRPLAGGLDGMAVASDRPAAPPGMSAAPAGGGQFGQLMEIVQQQLDAGSLAEALETLSRFYGDPRFSADESRQLTEILDQVAGTVIYSRQHLLEPPHVVRAGETLDQIAAEYDVPAGLLAKINGVRDPKNLQPGSQLKVVRGPFNAVVNLEKRDLSLMLQGRYAGRFRIGVGRDCPSLEGTYEVKDKTVNPTYYGRDKVVDAEDPANPWGERWIGLGNPAGAAQATPVGIHGTDNPLNIGATADRGAICLGKRDVEDVYDILSIGSRVVIRR